MTKINALLLTLFFFTILLGCKAQKQSNEEKIFRVYNDWKSEALKKGVLLLECPPMWDTIEHNYPTNFIGSFGTEHLSCELADINNDSVPDALITFVNNFCMGADAWSESQYPLLIVSNKNDYFIDTTTLEKIKTSINTHFDNLNIAKSINASRINFTNISDMDYEKIQGKCSLWIDEDPTCCPSISTEFTYNKSENFIEMIYTKEEISKINENVTTKTKLNIIKLKL